MWKRSTKCDGGHCLEVETEVKHEFVYLRNNLDPRREITATRAEWRAFIEGVKAGDFD